MDVQHDQDDRPTGGSALATLLDARRERIVTRWCERVLSATASRAPSSVPELVDHLPIFLARVAEDLRRAADRSTTEAPKGRPEAFEHGEQRWRLGFDVRSIVWEYDLVQQVVYDLVEEEQTPVRLDELRLFSCAITRGIGDAVEAFAARREAEIEEREARLRRLAEAERERMQRAADERAALEQELLAIVSHDLRNPLSAILMTAEWLLRSGTLEDEVARSLERVRSSGTRATELIEDLLDYTRARIGAGIEVKPEDARLHAIAATVVEEVRAAHPGRTIEHERTGDDAGVWDARRIGQVVANLVANAVQHSPRDSVVHVRTYGRGDGVVFEVHNEGAPMPPELLPHLFEPFRRGGAPGKRRLGLGLYIANRIVVAHGGTIDVSSNEVDGTTFRVWLPREHDAEA